jgi:transposase
MKKALYCGIDLHSNNAVYFISDGQDKVLFKKRIPNRLAIVLDALEPFRKHLEIVAVESTYNWYWLVDGLMDRGYPVRLVHPTAIEQYNGIKLANDFTDAAFLAHLGRQGILPVGYIYPKQTRPVRDLLRRRMLLVRYQTSTKLSLQNMMTRQTGQNLSCPQIRQLSDEDRRRLLGDNEPLLFVMSQQLDLIEQLHQKIKRFEQTVLAHTQLNPDYDCLLTMPGVGVILGLTITLETGDIRRFPRVGDYTSYCRCVRALCKSNGKTKGKNNSKNGNKYLSWAFVEAVHRALGCCPAAKKFYDRKFSKHNGALATKALAAKWSKAAYYMMKRQEAFDLKRVFG